MTLTKKTMVREIGRRTRLKNRDVQMMLETLIAVWTEELAEGSGRIELEGFMVLEVDIVTQSKAFGLTGCQATEVSPYQRLRMRTSKYLRSRLNPDLSLDD